MTSSQKHRVPIVVKWVSLLCRENYTAPLRFNFYGNGLYQYPVLQHFKFGTIKRAVNSNFVTLGVPKKKNWFLKEEKTIKPRPNGNLGELAKKSIKVRRELQAVLSEYFYFTRCLEFMDAENMSKNTPLYFENLLKRVNINDGNNDGNIGTSLTRFLWYHPINEFEPFFESIGLSPTEYSSFIPQNSIFLRDEERLLENYYVLCEYGIARNKIGNFFKGAREIFDYGPGVLQSKLLSFTNLGLSQSFIGKSITSSPYLLIGESNMELFEALANLKEAGIGRQWLEKHMSDKDFYDWKCILHLISLLSEVGLRGVQLRELIKQHPDMLFERSGGISVFLLGFFLKFGFTLTDIKNVFLRFPIIPIVKFKNNLCRSYEILVVLGIDICDIGMILHLNPLLLGSCKLKTVNTLVYKLRCGTKQLKKMIMDDPNVLKAWVCGKRVERLPQNYSQESRRLKTNFLLNLGFVENSKEMENALKRFRGNGFDLQEKFDFLVSAGLSHEEVAKMLKKYPNVIGLSKAVIERKIGLLWSLGYSLSSRISAALSCPDERLRQRLLTYQWLVDEGALGNKIGLSTLVTCSDKKFVNIYVNSHPRGLEFWKNLQKLPQGIQESRKLKTSFLLNLGFVENSKEMKEAFKKISGKGSELQKRFNYLVSTGLSEEEVKKMIKALPGVLNLSNDVVKSKICEFVNLGYKVSDLVGYPATLLYSAERVQKRVLTYQWLRAEGALSKILGLNTLLSPSDKVFVNKYVNSHPRGLDFWERPLEQVRPDLKGVAPLAQGIQESTKSRNNFLLNLGFVENSEKMKNAAKVCRATGFELQERFDCLVSGGLSREEVTEMVKACPSVLRLSKDVLKRKIGSFVNLGYKVSHLVAYPATLCFPDKRVQRRLLTYQWLRDQGALSRNTSLYTLVGCTDKIFVNTYVNSHPRGLEFWENLQKLAPSEHKRAEPSELRVDQSELRWVYCLPQWIQESRKLKTSFLLNLGFVENSKEVKDAFKNILGKGSELQKRFDYLVSTGFSQEEVKKMIKVFPILNLSNDVVKSKISLFVNLGYKVSDLVSYPRGLCFTAERVQKRVLTYQWLRAEGALSKILSLYTILNPTDKVFVNKYVNSHARGLEFWERPLEQVRPDLKRVCSPDTRDSRVNKVEE